MNVNELIILCWKLRKWIVAAGAAGGIFTFIVGSNYVTYEATAYLLVRPLGEVSEANLGSPNVGLTYTAQMDKFATHGRTYMKLIKSRHVMEQVVDRQDLQKTYEGANPFVESVKQPLRYLYYGRLPANKMTPKEMAIEQTTMKTKVNMITLSSILEINFRDNNADRATRTVNEITNVFLEYAQERSASSVRQTRENLETQIDEIRAELKKQRERLVEANEARGVHIFSDKELERERQRLVTDISLLQNRLEETRYNRSVNLGKIAKMDEQLADFPEQTKAISTVTSNPAIQKLKESLITANVALQQLLVDYKPESPQVKAAESQIEFIKQSIDREAATILGQETVQLDPVRQQLLQTYVTLNVDTEALPIAEESLSARIEAQSKTAAEFEAAMTEIGEITRTIGSLLATESRLISLGETAKAVEAAAMNEVEVIEAAMIPRYPSLRNAPLAAYVILGGIGAAVLAVGIGFWREQQATGKLFGK